MKTFQIWANVIVLVAVLFGEGFAFASSVIAAFHDDWGRATYLVLLAGYLLATFQVEVAKERRRANDPTLQQRAQAQAIADAFNRVARSASQKGGR